MKYLLLPLAFLFALFFAGCGGDSQESLTDKSITEIEQAIRNNLRQLASGADQYFLEEGVTTVRTEVLMGSYVRELNPVDGETYPEVIRLGSEIRATGASIGDVVIEF